MTGRPFHRVVSELMLIAFWAFAGLQSAYGQTRDFNLSAQSATTGIPEFARQAGIQILVSEPLVRNKRVAAVTGVHSVDDALAILLKGTGLVATSKDGATYTLAVAAPPTPGSSNSSATPNPASAQLAPYDAPPGFSADASSDGVLEEVVVTAQKREERLLDVPVPVTAISGATLADSDQVQINDYYTRVPGLSVSNEGYHSSSTIAIRGVTTGGFTNPAVGIVVDDVPFGSATSNGFGNFVPDFDPSDLARIEVLRGPQGTLYGANSMGGLLKYVTIDPSTDAVTGRLQAGANGIHNGSDTGYNVRAAVNVPLTDQLAIRASGYTRQDPGYIDNPILDIDGINRQRTSGGRLSALWRPSSSLSLKLSALYQDIEGDGANYVDVEPDLGDLQQNYIRGSGRYSHRNQIYSAVLNARIGDVALTSITGYSISKNVNVADLTPFWGSLAQDQFQVSGAASSENARTSKFSQEVRLAAKIGEHFDWLIGGFYTDESTPNVQIGYAADPAVGQFVGELYNISLPSTYREYAAFADVTYHFTDRFDVQIGGREGKNKQSYQETDSGLAFTPPSVNPTIHSEDSSFTYLLTPRFKISPDMMLYARLASGYRPGGPNTVSVPGIPSQFNPDKTKDYEVGFKGSLLEQSLYVDASLYDIDWQDIQISLLAPNGIGYYSNGGSAKSAGAEVSVQLRPVKSVTLGAWVAYDDAKLTQNFPIASTAIGVSGDRLPTSSRLSGNLTLDQDVVLMAGITGFWGGSLSYVGNRLGVFSGSPERQYFPGYAQLDLRAGLRRSAWTLNLFLTNVADKRAPLAGGLGTGPFPFAFIFNRPRTIGGDLSWSF